MTKPDLKPVPPEVVEELDEEELEFRAHATRFAWRQRQSARAGIVAISVAKAPLKNEFFRTHADFQSVVPIVDLEVGMERQFFAVEQRHDRAAQRDRYHRDRPQTLSHGHETRGTSHCPSANQADSDGEQNEYARTKELACCKAGPNGCGCTSTRRTRQLQSVSGATWSFQRAAMARAEAGEDVQARRSATRADYSTASSIPLFKKWAARDSD